MNRIAATRSLLFASLLTGLGLMALPMANAGQGGGGQVLEAQPLHAPQSRMEAEVAIDASVAGAIIGAIVTSFDERDVQVKLDDVDLQPIDLEQSQATGHGRLKIGSGKDAPWIEFSYATLYDTLDSTASQPRLVLGGNGNAQSATAMARQQLTRDMQARLQAEFPQQDPAVHVQGTRAQALGAGLTWLQADAEVDFGAEGTALASIDALYDSRSQRLLRVDYQL